MIVPVGVGDYAVGFSLSKEGQGWYFQHGGGNWGFRANVVAHTAKGYGVTMMTNADQGTMAIREIEERVERAYGWDTRTAPVPRRYRPPPTIDVPATEPERFVGAYEREGDPSFTVDLRDGVLHIAVEDDGPSPIRPVTETTFVRADMIGEVRFAVEGGRVTGFVLRLGGSDRLWTRVNN